MSTKNDGPKGRNVWAGPNPEAKGKDDKWQVRDEGASKPIATFPTQSAAEDAARERARAHGSESVVQRPDGKIRDKDSHGHESPKHDRDGHKK